MHYKKALIETRRLDRKHKRLDTRHVRDQQVNVTVMHQHKKKKEKGKKGGLKPGKKMFAIINDPMNKLNKTGDFSFVILLLTICQS